MAGPWKEEQRRQEERPQINEGTCGTRDEIPRRLTCAVPPRTANAQCGLAASVSGSALTRDAWPQSAVPDLVHHS